MDQEQYMAPPQGEMVDMEGQEYGEEDASPAQQQQEIVDINTQM